MIRYDKKTHMHIKVYEKKSVTLMQSTYSWLQDQNNKLPHIWHALKYSLQKQVKLGINAGGIN